MIRAVIVVGKVVTLAVIVWGIVSWIVPDSIPLSGVGRIFAIALPAVHLLELPLYRKLIGAVGGSRVVHAAQVIAFGLFHKLDMEQTLRGRQQG